MIRKLRKQITAIRNQNIDKTYDINDTLCTLVQGLTAGSDKQIVSLFVFCWFGRLAVPSEFVKTHHQPGRQRNWTPRKPRKPCLLPGDDDEERKYESLLYCASIKKKTDNTYFSMESLFILQQNLLFTCPGKHIAALLILFFLLCWFPVIYLYSVLFFISGIILCMGSTLCSGSKVSHYLRCVHSYVSKNELLNPNRNIL